MRAFITTGIDLWIPSPLWWTCLLPSLVWSPAGPRALDSTLFLSSNTPSNTNFNSLSSTSYHSNEPSTNDDSQVNKAKLANDVSMFHSFSSSRLDSSDYHVTYMYANPLSFRFLGMKPTSSPPTSSIAAIMTRLLLRLSTPTVPNLLFQTLLLRLRDNPRTTFLKIPQWRTSRLLPVDRRARRRTS